MRKVPFFNYPYLFESQKEKFLEIFEDVGSRGAFILQRDLDEFEQGLAKFSGAKYSLGVANGTDAIIICLRAIGLEPGDEVIMSSHTYIATAAAVALLGGVPVPIECGADWMMDPSKIEESVTGKTRVIMPTQVNGRTCDMDAIQAIADKHNLTIVEDAAQALGSKFKERGAGTFGIGGTISFYPAKTLGSFGDAGAILTNDEDFYAKICLLRDHGRDDDGKFLLWGYNSRLDNLQAAFLNFKLGYYQEEIERRREIAEIYNRELSGIEGVRLPPAPDADSNHYDVYQNYEIWTSDRDKVREHLSENGVGTLIQWNGQPVHSIKELGFNQELPFTDEFFSGCCMIPMNTSLSDEDVLYVCSQIKSYFS